MVFIHCFAIADITNTSKIIVFQQWLCHVSFCSWAVPFFFIVSGFWFSQSSYLVNRESYWHFCSKKFKSLLIPYLCFNVLGFLFSLPRLCHDCSWNISRLKDSLFGGGLGIPWFAFVNYACDSCFWWCSMVYKDTSDSISAGINFQVVDFNP